MQALLRRISGFRPRPFRSCAIRLKRFVSGFLNKVFTDGDINYFSFRDMLTSIRGIDLSPEADPRQSCLGFAKWIASQKDQKVFDPHFKPQHLNLAVGGRFTVDTILRLEDQDAVLAFFARWVGVEKAKWLLSIRLNVRTKYTDEEVVTDELVDLVRKIYARDYELF